MASKIKKGDKVFVIAGKDKGKEGEVLRILKDNQAFVQGVNLVKKHKKPSQEDEGGITDQESPINLSNLMVIDSKSKKPILGQAWVSKTPSKRTQLGPQKLFCAGPSWPPFLGGS